MSVTCRPFSINYRENRLAYHTHLPKFLEQTFGDGVLEPDSPLSNSLCQQAECCHSQDRPAKSRQMQAKLYISHNSHNTQRNRVSELSMPVSPVFIDDGHELVSVRLHDVQRLRDGGVVRQRRGQPRRESRRRQPEPPEATSAQCEACAAISAGKEALR